MTEHARRTDDKLVYKMIPLLSSSIGIVVGGLIFYGMVSAKLESNEKFHEHIETKIDQFDDRIRMVEKAVVSLEDLKVNVNTMRGDIKDIRNIVVQRSEK